MLKAVRAGLAVGDLKIILISLVIPYFRESTSGELVGETEPNIT